MGWYAMSADSVHHGGMMRCGGGVKEGGIGEETIPTTCKLAHRTMMVVVVVLRPPQGPTPGF